jgi:hypothetical protein
MEQNPEGNNDISRSYPPPRAQVSPQLVLRPDHGSTSKRQNRGDPTGFGGGRSTEASAVWILRELPGLSVLSEPVGWSECDRPISVSEEANRAATESRSDSTEVEPANSLGSSLTEHAET